MEPPIAQAPIAPSTSQPVLPPEPKKSNSLVLILLLLLFFLLGAGATYAWQNWLEINPFKPKEVACTLEAKLCPDGTSVGRTGPNCEFAPCPTATPTSISQVPADWKTYMNKKYLFQLQYPLSYSQTLDPEENDIWFDFPGSPYPPEIVININVNSSKPNDTLSGYVEESINYLRTQKLTGPNDFKIIKTNEMQLGGEKAIRLNYQRSGFEQEAIYTIHANYRYSINRFSINNAGGKLVRSEEFDQILSTFKFLP